MESLLGRTMVGYRYGAAPECGFSYNTATQSYECGLSMASVGFCNEIGSFAVSGASSRKKHYFVGEIAGEGGDDEICLINFKQITAKEYADFLKKESIISTSNDIVNKSCDREIRLINAGWSTGKTKERVEQLRIEQLSNN